MGFFKKKIENSIEEEMNRLTSGAAERAGTGSDPELARQHAETLAEQLQQAGQADAQPGGEAAAGSTPAGVLAPGFQLPAGVTPIVIGNPDPERIQEALARASQLLGVDLTGAINAAAAASNPAGAATVQFNAAAGAGAPAAGGGDLVDRLERLAKLRDSGAITDAEFTTQKQRLLSE